MKKNEQGEVIVGGMMYAGEWVPVEDHNSESGLKRRT